MTDRIASYYALVAYEPGDWLGKEPTTLASWLELVRGEIEEGNFGACG